MRRDKRHASRFFFDAENFLQDVRATDSCFRRGHNQRSDFKSDSTTLLYSKPMIFWRRIP